MDYLIKRLEIEQYGMIPDFLYEAIFIPEGEPKPPKDIIERPELKLYYENFGVKDDFGFIAESANGETIGIVWTRVMNDYGHIDDDTPSLAIAVKESYRGNGIGTALMKAILDLLKDKGYKGVSLSVQNANRAARLYIRLGFKTVINKEDEQIMLIKL